MNTLRFAFICLVAGLTLGFLFGGCGEAPESFHLQQCEKTPGDLYSYVCVTPGYERCWTATGAVKYANCEYMGIYCVASCSEVD